MLPKILIKDNGEVVNMSAADVPGTCNPTMEELIKYFDKKSTVSGSELKFLVGVLNESWTMVKAYKKSYEISREFRLQEGSNE